MTTNQGFKNFIPNAETDLEFLFYLLKMQTPGFIGLCSGSTFLEISKLQVASYKVSVPWQKKQQEKISSALASMDDDISVLQDKLAKHQTLKQGMMQNLLTGTVRLV
ncbi:restriction endonuclease subunit S [Endozoicomonas sp. SCSIO W0465]|uniref:restriction endonuclease subunit S n=1 Tax=Endozoicomonas sp. SCSIO W0465 TaxID=2918516 RepID=UPI002075964A|nr:restriction endonuclease subunit S [Endozoicomonas sp. SCSIO W0465]USE38699.1 restriction endonuclease subunit S [Endozoicomonas sp. SCSIO W0465]